MSLERGVFLKEGYKKISFDISKENCDYLINMKKNTNISASALLNIVLDRFRTNETDISAYAIKVQSLDKKIKILEKDLQKLKDFKKELSYYDYEEYKKGEIANE